MIMKHLSVFISLVFDSSFAQDGNSSAVLPSDFFAGVLEDAKSSGDELGTQRLVEVKNSDLTLHFP